LDRAAQTVPAPGPAHIAGAGHLASLSRAILRVNIARGSDGAAPVAQVRSPTMTLRELTSRHGDRLIAAALAALYCAEIATESHFAGDRAISFPAALAFCAALAWRRRAPLVALALAVVIVELSNLAAPALAETGAFLVGILLAIYSAGRYTRGPALVAGLVLVAAAIPLAAIEPGDPVAFTDIAFFAVLFGGPWVVGRFARHRAARERVLVAERDVRAQEAVAEERTRIARELHDVVAHAISVIVLQARGGRRMLSDEPDETRRALDVIEHAGEQALGEMRRLLGLLREDEPELTLAPPPSLRRLDELVAGTRASGLPVEVVIEGEPVELPPGVDVSAYRIVQEALTNALKHAGPAHARVTITYARDAVDLAIVDDGAGVPSINGSGYGLAGMRERVAIYGGRLESGARPEGGYALRVRLPLPAAR
jgi:signal transduction histidine kinase